MEKIMAGAPIFALLFYFDEKARRRWYYPIFHFFATLPHELSHFVVALLLGGKPSLPSFIPKKRGNCWVLGEVRFRATPFNAFPSGMAPLLLFPLAVYVYSLPFPYPAKEIGVWFLLKASIPSSQDVKVAFSHLIAGLLWIAVLLFAVELLRKFDV